ncbi:glycoside hydrolase family 15 protein [Chromohalobacter moromii]|uniref:Glycoside hydrolase family 15 protein n=1 Tax=Chromohalobacter moromii TaxID=2860329 RepID=A0A9X2X2B1_9GAMM|nr:glycoside hydrolase family 15 protein [Chromohalobacter moromii]MCK2045289.1 glycoside hydrolase family 15 protein [Chromohalobacter moromii]MCT8505044.1 glycoside hydrolase family 15 protein [Chromohalobacter moromii]
MVGTSDKEHVTLTQDPTLELGLVGNCQVSALIDDQSRIVWFCFPRLDSAPVFSRLVDTQDSGYFAIDVENRIASHQYYVRNTAILCTEIEDTEGGKVRITDFCPRFLQFGREFHPTGLCRRVERVAGTPVIRTRLRPVRGYDGMSPDTTHGSHHIRYLCQDDVMRLTTDASITHLLQESAHALDRPLHFIIGPDESLTTTPARLYNHYWEETSRYWHDWVSRLAVPFEWQNAVIRAAITLKLSTFDDTGAVVAAMTTSIPEAANTQRNWDYRYCWLRDSYFVVHALNRLGATGTMENFLHYIIDLVVGTHRHQLQPLYGIGGETVLDEHSLETLAGYHGMGPVRVGNAAYLQNQHDVYGAVILAANQVFFDQRLEEVGNETLFRRLEPLGHLAAECYDQPDASIWEYRGRERVHTYSAIMCWAACDRLAKIAAQLDLDSAARHWRDTADTMHRTICTESWNQTQDFFAESFGGEGLDASLLLINELGFLPADDPRFVATVKAIGRHLRRGDHLFRYVADDDFGAPENAFNICTFWYIDALWAIGEHTEARRLFEGLLACRNKVGLLSEDLDPDSRRLWGNFPQTYSMVGLINSALHLSKSWEEAL